MIYRIAVEDDQLKDERLFMNLFKRTIEKI